MKVSSSLLFILFSASIANALPVQPNQADHGTANSNSGPIVRQSRALPEFNTEGLVEGAKSLATSIKSGIETVKAAGEEFANANFNNATLSDIKKSIDDGIKYISSLVSDKSTSTKRSDENSDGETFAAGTKQESKHTYPAFFEGKREFKRPSQTGFRDALRMPQFKGIPRKREIEDILYSFETDEGEVSRRSCEGSEDHDLHYKREPRTCPYTPHVKK